MKLLKIKTATFIALIGLFSASLFSGCEYDYVADFPAPPLDTTLPDLSFKDVIIPIFNESCNSSSCHGVGAIPPDLSPSNAHSSLMSTGMIDVANPTASILYTKMHTGSMMSFATEEQTAKVLTWIQQGAKNN